jgi:Spy/CpxP family protein refolding chaperone
MIKAMKRSLRLTTLAVGLSGGAAYAQPVTAPIAKANRPALEQQFRERVAKLTQDRVGLTDAQMAQLQQSNARFAPQLSQIAAQERETRRQLRQELTSAGEPNQQHVSALLDTSLQLQKQRIAIVEAEQKELARFMTPVQRARYIGLQQQFRRRAQELAGQNGAEKSGMGQQRNRPGLKKSP